MGRKETDRQHNITLSGERSEALEAYMKAHGISKNSAIDTAVGLLVTDALKAQMPDAAQNIEDFEINLQRIMTLYRMSIEHSATIRTDAADRIAESEARMEVLAKENMELQDLKAELERTKNALQAAQAQITDIQACARENAELKLALAEEKSRHANEIRKVHDEEFEKIKELFLVMGQGQGRSDKEADKTE